MDQMNMTNDDIMDEDDNDSNPHSLSQEDREALADHIEESALMIGFRPITDEAIDIEADKIKQDPNTKEKHNESKIYNIAAINIIMKFETIKFKKCTIHSNTYTKSHVQKVSIL